MNIKSNRLICIFGAFAIVVLVLVSTSLGQEFRATITGAVTDPNGAAVSGATIIIKNNATNISNTVTTNDEGSFTVPFLLPGIYTVTATSTGFKTSTREKVEVKVDER